MLTKLWRYLASSITELDGPRVSDWKALVRPPFSSVKETLAALAGVISVIPPVAVFVIHVLAFIVAALVALIWHGLVALAKGRFK